MAKKLVLSKSELKMKKTMTVDAAKSAIRSGGWIVALFPFFIIGLILATMVFDFDVPRSVSRFVGLVPGVLIMLDVRYMRTFYGANLSSWGWSLMTYLFPMASFAYLFVRTKHIKGDEKLYKTSRAQAHTCMVGCIIWLLLVTIGIVSLFIPDRTAPKCWDPQVKELFVEVLEDNANISDVKIDNIVEEDYTDGVRTCTAFKVKYTDLDNGEDASVSYITYNVQVVDGEDGLHYLVSIPE